MVNPFDLFGLNPANPWNQVNPASPYHKNNIDTGDLQKGENGQKPENKFECGDHSYDFLQPNQTPTKNSIKKEANKKCEKTR